MNRKGQRQPLDGRSPHGLVIRTDFILLLIAAYVAVITRPPDETRHDEAVADVQRQVDAHRRDKNATPVKRDAA
jgi:hypothetical protein